MRVGLFINSVNLLIQNWQVAVRLSWIWFALVLAASFWTAGIFGFSIVNDEMRLNSGFKSSSTTGFVLPILVSLVIYIVGVTSVAIGWHRYILLNEKPSKFHLFGSNFPLFAYFLTGLKIAFVILLAWIPVAFIALPLITSVISVGNSLSLSLAVGYIFGFTLGIAGIWISLRLSLALPAIAVGVDMGLRDSFNITRQISFELLATAVFLVLIQYIPTFLFSLVHLSINASIVVGGVLDWFCFMVGVGVLTNAYRYLSTQLAT